VDNFKFKVSLILFFDNFFSKKRRKAQSGKVASGFALEVLLHLAGFTISGLFRGARLLAGSAWQRFAAGSGCGTDRVRNSLLGILSHNMV
jgi:hypothetical protein